MQNQSFAEITRTSDGYIKILESFVENLSAKKNLPETLASTVTDNFMHSAVTLPEPLLAAVVKTRSENSRADKRRAIKTAF